MVHNSRDLGQVTLFLSSLFPHLLNQGSLYFGKWRTDWRPTEKARGITALPAPGSLPLHDAGMFRSVYLSVFCFLHRSPKVPFEVHVIIALKNISVPHGLQIARDKAGPMAIRLIYY